jgi:hypothetical protein
LTIIGSIAKCAGSLHGVISTAWATKRGGESKRAAEKQRDREAEAEGRERDRGTETDSQRDIERGRAGLGDEELHGALERRGRRGGRPARPRVRESERR